MSVTIKWVSADILSLRPDWTHDECEAFLDSVHKPLQDRSIEFGWELLEGLLPPE